ncbi:MULTISPECIES: LexA family transcriptional regulator [unclassified Legionella]|uniref:LexA family protein n=1 Tax=unclassified Legionella TaxID=2622702 RepID=UPI0010564233|nr:MULTISPECIES: translesion error-prone DNA polymerase V autoproteolytic subunit [unclassified Legionella]MDI9817961.1 translesion error-prone DNA polymerase V autoproteolytic subunit [Legionella sp. PL877]
MVKGGLRAGAGRPKKFSEETKVLRVPCSKINEILAFIDSGKSCTIPLYSSSVRAGFPSSPADDYIESHLDLNTHLIKHPASTFFLIASGDSMTGAGIQSGDMLIVDKSLEAGHGKIVIAAIDGELTVKRLSKKEGRVELLPENSAYPAIDITDEQDLVIWGVVTHVIHRAS